MDITITQDHIASGDRGDCYGCPVALAITAIWPGAVSVQEDFILTHLVNGRFPTPARVRRFIRAFEKGRPVKPFTFSLPLE